MDCPICGSTKFQDKNGRKNARCSSCKAMERTRLMYMALDKLDVLKPNIRILHLEPEPAMVEIFSKLSPSGYFPCSVNIDNNQSGEPKIHKLESYQDIIKFPHQSFDLIIHSHILEKIALPVKYTINVFSDLLKSNGFHFFSTDLDSGLSRIGIEGLTEAQRKEQFGDSQKYYKFGKDDFILMMQDLWQKDIVYIDNNKVFGLDQYLNAALPKKIFNMVTSYTVFYHQKTQL